MGPITGDEPALAGRLRPLIYRWTILRPPQELAPCRFVSGGCPGVFGPEPSAGLDEPDQSSGIAPRRSRPALAKGVVMH
jgi:hypothetical protein